MTSENLYLGKVRISQVEMLKRRKWFVALLALVLFMLYVFAIVLSSFETRAESAHYFSSLFSIEDPVLLVIATAAGTGAAFDGFAFLHKKDQVDFYESKPYTRKHRFISITVNSLAIFVVLIVAFSLIGFVIASAKSGQCLSFVNCLIKPWLIMTAVFFSCFSISALAMLLTGNTFVAGLAVMVFYFAESFIRVLTREFAGELIRTKSLNMQRLPYLVFPPIVVWDHVKRNSGLLITLFHCLIIGVLALVLAFIVYKVRRSESAGESVVFQPVRHIAKIFVCLNIALAFALIGYEMNGPFNSIIMCFVLGAISCAAMECIYSFDVRAWKKNLIEDVCICVVAFAIFGGTEVYARNYDAWLPAANEVESSAVVTYYLHYIRDDGVDYPYNEDYYRDTMKLKDTEDVLNLARAGIKALDNDGYYSSESIEIIFRLKNGKEVTRKYTVPEEDFKKYFEPISNTAEFKKSFFQIAGDGILDKKTDKFVIFYSNSNGAMSADAEKIYPELKDAYMKDLEGWDYDFASKTMQVGKFVIKSKKIKIDPESPIYETGFPVYAKFTNTLEVLKKYGIFLDANEEEGPFYKYSF